MSFKGVYKTVWIEDEYHVVLHCPSYHDIREKFIDPEFITPKNIYTFCNLFSTECDLCVCQLAMFVYHMFKLRKSSYLNVE